RRRHTRSKRDWSSDVCSSDLELGFGFKEGLDPMKIMLPNGYELVLRGRIDRVDRSVENDQLYLRIIDYKSSSRGLDLVEVYYGRSEERRVGKEWRARGGRGKY